MNKIIGDSEIERWIEVTKHHKRQNFGLAGRTVLTRGIAANAAGKREVDEVKVFEAFGGDLPVHGVRRKLKGK